MRFFQFKEFRPGVATNMADALASVVDYLGRELKVSLRELATGLERLSFADNFRSYITTVTIPSGEELAIRHNLDIVPTQRIILRSDEGGLGIVDGDTEWSNQFVYLKNTSGSAGTVTVAFLA